MCPREEVDGEAALVFLFMRETVEREKVNGNGRDVSEGLGLDNNLVHFVSFGLN